MAEPLKEQNNFRLIAVVVANLAIFLMILKADLLAAADFKQLTKDIGDIVPAALTIALLTVANGLIAPETKARLVFWRWSNPLPGSRAFSDHAHRDPRIDVRALERKLGPLPVDAREQNTTWYRLYQTVEEVTAVRHNHRDYLFTRDYASLSVLLLVMLGGLALYQTSDWSRTILYILLLVAQYLTVRHVASRYGHRFVTTVLAVSAAEE